jgi:toxic protein SymE
MTVTMYPESRPRVPWIRMRGKWLARAGFNPDTRIRVRVMEGCLVITADAGDDE